MEKRDYQVIKSDFDRSINNRDIHSIIKFQKELIESGIRSKGDWFRLAFLCGREGMKADLEAFMRANQLRLKNDFGDGSFGSRFSEDFQDIHFFYQVGARYPFLNPSDYEFLESYYTKSGTYTMIDEMLFDKDLLQRELKHYEPHKIENKSLSYSPELLQSVFKAALDNNRKYNFDELLETRYSQRRSSYEPVYVYNMETNAVELTTSKVLDEWTKHILGQDYSTNHLIQQHCRSIFGSDKVVIEVLNELDMINPHFDVDMHFDASLLWLIIKRLCEKLEITTNDSRIIQLENELAEELLKRINSEGLY